MCHIKNVNVNRCSLRKALENVITVDFTEEFSFDLSQLFVELVNYATDWK